MTELEPHRTIPTDTRRQIAATLASYYAELTDLAPHDSPASFSLSRLLHAHANRMPIVGREKEIPESGALLLGQEYNPHRAWIPLRAIRALGTTPGAKGGYLVGADTANPADVLRPWSVAASAGVQIMTGLTDVVPIPRVTSAATASWIGENGSGASETPPTLGSASLTPKTAIALVKFSAQLLKQGEAVENFLRAQLLSAVGELLDQAFLAGPGGAAPLGLTNTPGIGTQSGSSLAHAGVLAMRRQVLAAGGIEGNVQWVGTPTVHEVLGARERATGGGRFLWDSDGILGRPAHATKTAPSATLVVGDFSTAVIGVFGPGVRIDIDPSQDFGSAGLVARVMLMADIGFPQPGAFSVSTAVS